jgi:uncharacterized protein (DUF305 family)
VPPAAQTDHTVGDAADRSWTALRRSLIVHRSARRATPALVPLLTALALTGCTADAEPQAAGVTAPVVQPGAPGEGPKTLSPEQVQEIQENLPEASEDDIAFFQGMVPHHQQALQRTSLVPDRAASERVKLFAKRIDATQEAEIEQMQDWLLVLGEVFGTDGRHHSGELMPGMLTDEQLAELEAASGEEFDRMFLELMIQHHIGAMSMVADLRASERGGQDPAVWQLANHIESDQSIEIDRMEQMLAELDAR